MTLGEAAQNERVRFIGGRWGGRCAVVLDESGQPTRKVLLDGPDEVDFFLESDRPVERI